MFATVEASPLLLVLWREQHPNGHEQIAFDFTLPIVTAGPRHLFDHEEGVDQSELVSIRDAQRERALARLR